MMRKVEIGTMVKFKHDGFGIECVKNNTAFVVEAWSIGGEQHGYELVCESGRTISATREDFSIMRGEALRLPVLTPEHHRNRMIDLLELDATDPNQP